MVNSICYHYSDKADADCGNDCGGTGFLIFRKSPKDGKDHYYAITNRHVIDDGFPIIRINSLDGGNPHILELPKENWVFHKQGADVAAAYLVNSEKYDFEGINSIHILNKEDLDPQDIHAPSAIMYGSEVFMIGHFAKSPGLKRNRPVLRLGTVAQFPDSEELITYDENIAPQEAYLVEMHSIDGFSGSPVFHISIGMQSFLSVSTILESVYKITAPEFNWEPNDRPINVIGIDAGAFVPRRKVEIRDGDSYLGTNYEVKTPSGFSIVIPSWKIKELLLQPELAPRNNC